MNNCVFRLVSIFSNSFRNATVCRTFRQTKRVILRLRFMFVLLWISIRFFMFSIKKEQAKSTTTKKKKKNGEQSYGDKLKQVCARILLIDWFFHFLKSYLCISKALQNEKLKGDKFQFLMQDEKLMVFFDGSTKGGNSFPFLSSFLFLF